MRSGSSFAGKVLGFRDDTFYWYEPLITQHFMEYLSAEGTWCEYGSSECGNKTVNATQTVRNALQPLSDIYNCEHLYGMEKYFSIHQKNVEKAGPTADVYQRCLNTSSDCPTCNSSKTILKAECKRCLRRSSDMCFRETMDTCTKAKHRVMKVLRISAAHAHHLLERHDRLKVILLLRDPRAVIYSRITSRWSYKDGLSTPVIDARALCIRMEKDIASVERLSVLFPDRLKIVQYEEFYDIESLALSLYTFLNMELTESASQLMDVLLNADEVRGLGFHPDSYRYNMDWTIVEAIHKACRGVIEQLGLRVFKNAKELVDTNLSLVVDSLPYEVIETEY